MTFNAGAYATALPTMLVWLTAIMCAAVTSKAKPKTILDVLTGLFAPLFPPTTWRPWGLAAAAGVGLTYGLTPDDEAFIRQCLGRTKLPTQRAQRAVFVIGR